MIAILDELLDIDKADGFVGYFAHYCVGAQRYELPASTLKPLHPDCNTFATPNRSKQNNASLISREAF